MSQTVKISGIYRDANGQAEANAELTLTLQFSTPYATVGATVSVKTDGKGSYSVELHPGLYRTWIKRKDGTTAPVGMALIFPSALSGELPDYLLTGVGGGDGQGDIKQIQAQLEKFAKLVIDAAEQATEASKKAAVDLPADTDLNTVRKPGRYRLIGSDQSMRLNYPIPVMADSEVFLDVTVTKGYGSSAVITQTFTGSQLGNSPGPYVRNNANGDIFGSWAVNVTESYVSSRTLALLNISQADFNVAAVVQNSVHSYQAPDGTASKPNKKTAPSANGGVKLTLRWQYSKSRQGTFGGAVIAVDEKGKAFLQTDYNVPSNNDGSIPESSINWQEFITSPVKERKAIPNATDSTLKDTVNAVLALLRDRGLLAAS